MQQLLPCLALCLLAHLASALVPFSNNYGGSRCRPGYYNGRSACFRSTLGYSQRRSYSRSLDPSNPCDQPGESVVTGEDPAVFNEAKQIVIDGKARSNGNGGGNGNVNSGSVGNPGSFYWTSATAADSQATTYTFPDGQPARDSNGNVIVRDPATDPECLASWSKSPDFVPMDCSASIAAICQLPYEEMPCGANGLFTRSRVNNFGFYIPDDTRRSHSASHALCASIDAAAYAPVFRAEGLAEAAAEYWEENGSGGFFSAGLTLNNGNNQDCRGSQACAGKLKWVNDGSALVSEPWMDSEFLIQRRFQANCFYVNKRSDTTPEINLYDNHCTQLHKTMCMIFCGEPV